MFIHLRHELSYDTSFANSDLIYRIASNKWAKTSPPLAVVLKEEFPETSNITRFYFSSAQVLRFGDKTIPTQQNYLVDQAVFSVFGFQFIYGNPEKALLDSKSIVITRDVSEKLFGDIDPTGKVILLDDYLELTVTGVMENIPSNSHLKIESLTALKDSQLFVPTRRPTSNENRSWKSVDTYVRFNSAEEAATIAGKLRDFEYRFYEGHRTKEEVDRDADYLEMNPITSIHLYSHKEKEMGKNSDVQYVYIFAVLACFIILVAGINFINLFTAQSVRRMKEIGIKKVMGATRSQLFQQFINETFLMTLFSTILAIALAGIFLPFYNELSGLSITPANLVAPSNLLVLAMITIAVATLSGFYPALVISKYRITESLGRYSPKGGVGLLRKMLVTFQFVISCLVILLTVVVSRQMDFIQGRDLGMSSEGVVTIKLYGQIVKDLNDRKDVLKTQLMRDHRVVGVAVSSRVVGERIGYDGFALAGAQEDENIDARTVLVDEGFVPTLNLRLIEGRNFLPTDSTAFIINEEARRRLSEGEIIGKLFGYDASRPLGPIVGVVKDFNYASLHNEIEPLVMVNNPKWSNNLMVRVADMNKLQPTLEVMRKELSAFTPGALIIFNFMDDQMQYLYDAENKMFRIFNVFSVLSVIIAMLGLVALSAHAIESRVKEIGIRKVLGATVGDILVVLSTGYVKLLALASVLSIPLAWYLSEAWLASFAFRTGLEWWIFTGPCVLLVLVTLVVLAVQGLRPATADPVKSLRYE